MGRWAYPRAFRLGPWSSAGGSFLWAVLFLIVVQPSEIAAQPPIRIGEINSYSGIAAGFTLPYRQAVEMAVEEINAAGGLLGRRVEVLFRDDKGSPAEAVKHAQELLFAEKVHLLAGTFLSNVGLAVSDFARQNKTLFVAAEPLTEALTWSQGHRYAFRVRPNTYSQGWMLAERAAKLPYRQWAVIGPNYEYGRRAWETFWARLKELKPEVQLVGEYWPTLGKIEPSGYVTALLGQQPEAVYVSLFGSDWIAFAREAGKRGLFQKAFFVGILLGEPEYMDPLKLEAPQGMLVTGYPWYDIPTPAHKEFVAKFNRRTDRTPVVGSLVGYITFLSIFEAIRKAGSTDTEKLVAALEGLKVETPIGPITFRAFDHQSTMGAWVGTTKLDAKRGVGVMVNWEYIPGEKVLPSEAEVRKMREGSN
jgi:branched-chain amino acid transport system substrate-binding protein